MLTQHDPGPRHATATGAAHPGVAGQAGMGPGMPEAVQVGHPSKAPGHPRRWCNEIGCSTYTVILNPDGMPEAVQVGPPIKAPGHLSGMPKDGTSRYSDRGIWTPEMICWNAIEHSTKASIKLRRNGTREWFHRHAFLTGGPCSSEL
eukprot:1161297-Pelagomonas_calceolata.AAC.10